MNDNAKMYAIAFAASFVVGSLAAGIKYVVDRRKEKGLAADAMQKLRLYKIGKEFGFDLIDI